MILPVSIRNNKDMEFWLSKILTGRIGLISAKYDDIWSLGLGHIPQHSFDNMYFQLLYNYGWIIFIFCIVLYIIEMWYCNRKCQYYITIALGIMAIYGFMELLPLSALWNLPLLYLSQVLFRGEKKTHELLQ